MSDIDVLVREKFVPFRNRITDALGEKYPQLFSFFNMYLAGKKFSVGMQITEDGRKVSDYTLLVEGVKITGVECGVLSPEVQHPFGVIKPYAIVEKDALEKMLQDEQSFIDETFTMIQKYLPDITIKFMR
ncbi:hypothetical protein [Desulfallas thermosapovorans]|uniref:Uncharacterized protein n=1 Tax=Desulfallas thermosapovorans DSM 6562 TaxID=1121431 RepID=A0A5S4ZRN5_9FIRM|nr:hypothetical protein [Desulfallas thermosapovorans]TYO95316.1 hypothetical protein LX24_01666 [Desulfallas thermosapovorans DSM 6562]